MPRLLWVLSIGLGLSACKSDDNSGESQPAAATTEENAAIVPVVVAQPEAAGAELPPVIAVEATPPAESVPTEPEAPASEAGYQYPAMPPSSDLSEMPLLLDLPALRTDIDPLTFDVKAEYRAGLGKPPLLPPAGKILFPQAGQAVTYAACDFPIAAPVIATGLNWTIDGKSDDWQGKGLMAVDRLGDGIGGDSARDLRAFYVGESATHYYVFVKTATDPRTTSVTTSALNITFYEITPSNATGAKPIVYTARLNVGMWSNGAMYKTTTNTVVDRQYYEYAESAEGYELAISKTHPDLQTLGTLYAMRASFYKGTMKPSQDQMATPGFGMPADYSCLIPTPHSGFKMVTMQREAGIVPQQAEVAYRALIAVVPAVEYVIGEAYNDNDSFTYQMGLEGDGGYHDASHGIFSTDSYIGHLRNDMNMRVIDVFGHELAHGYNGYNWDYAERWIKEGHSNWIMARVAGVIHGPIVEHMITQRMRLAVLKDEAAALAPLSDFQTYAGSAVSVYYEKGATLLHELALRAGASVVDAALPLYGRRAGETGFAGPLLNAIASAPTYGLARSATEWNGWVNTGTTYAGAAFQIRPLGSTAATLGDGMSDAFKKAYGLDPALPLAAADRRMVADHSLADWELLAPLALKSASAGHGEAHTAICESGTRIKRYGVMFDGDALMLGVELDAPYTGANLVNIIASVLLPDGTKTQLAYQLGKEAATAAQTLPTSKTLRSAPLFQPSEGPTVEIFYHKTWAGWAGGLPAGSKLTTLFTRVGQDATWEFCDAFYDVAISASP